MSTKFFALLTQLGADKLANAAALGTKIEITHMAVGDGGGSLPTPDTKQTKLINEKRRAAINTLSIDPKNTNQIIAEQVIPENEGGWWIREIGLFDKDGILIAVGNCAETYKPQLQEGSGRTQTIRMILIVSSADAVTLKVDPSVVLATREYVDNSITKHANSRNHPDATLKEKGFVILSSAVDSNSETHAATPKAVKAAYDFANAANNNANGRVPAGRKVNGKALTADIDLRAGDVDAYNKTETDARVNEAKAQAKAANDNANGRVPSGRKVNGKALSADISLNAGDVGAYNKGETDARVNEAKAQANAANDNANGRVPSGRKVNGKALNADISLNAGDVGAYNKGETDARVNEAKNLANARLEKSKNGADIPNRDEFVKNLGLAETVERAGNAYPKTGGDIAGYINATGEITGANIIRSTGRSTVEIKSTAVPELTSRIGDAAWFHAYIPQKNGTIALLDDIPTPTPPTNIVQSVGQSTASVMSQKSVTDALNKKFNKTGGETSGEITAAGIVRARAVSTIEINANDSRPRITSRVGSEQWNNAYLQQKHGTIAYLDDIPAQTHIVQSTGQSTSSVMSQKSVTDTINGHGIGYSQSWVNVTGNRSAGAWYTNHTGRPIFIAVFVARDSNGGTEQSSASIAFSQNGNVIKLPLIRGANSGGAQRGAGSTIIPVGATYTVTTEFGGEINAWWELR